MATLLLVGAALSWLAHTPAPASPHPPASDSTARVTSARSAEGPTARLLRADSILVEKGERRMTLFQDGRAVRTYLVALGRNPVGDKERQGDLRTPEGRYRIDARNAQSRYHLALRISYPNAAHRAQARARGVSPGGDIMIHGLPKGFGHLGAAHRDRDWTEGCIALTNEEVEEVWQAVALGTPIHITP